MKTQSYQFHPIELAEYTRILPKLSGIDTTIYVDESWSFKRWNHPMWVIVSDDDSYNIWAAISVSDTPEILDVSPLQPPICGVSGKIQQCITFVEKFHQVLFDISTETVDSDVLHDIMTNYDWHQLSNDAVIEIYLEVFEKYVLGY